MTSRLKSELWSVRLRLDSAIAVDSLEAAIQAAEEILRLIDEEPTR